MLGFALVVRAVEKKVATQTVGTVTLSCDQPGSWRFILSARAEGGKEFVTVEMATPREAVPPHFLLSFRLPQQDVHHIWNINDKERFMLAPSWGSPQWESWRVTDLAWGMPLYTYFNDNNRNRLTLATSEVLREVEARLGVQEQDCVLCGDFGFFPHQESPLTHYKVTLLLDARDIFWSDAAREASLWMSETAGLKPCPVPEAAYEPLYSSWYQFHQNVFQKDIEEECAIAARLGMKTLIVDDGWQTDDTGGGYPYCGDWQISRRRFPDFPAHVKRVQDMGIKYMIWYSVPAIGEKSMNFERFKGKYLYRVDWGKYHVLDPRFPEVRQFLIDTYVKAVQDWGLDGLKLDFINNFTQRREGMPEMKPGDGRDIKTIPDAVNVLMKDVRDALMAIRPGILLEFRQKYVGPAIAQYGNMFRVSDCPGDLWANRIGICNLRVGAPRTAVHSDMIEWHLQESPEGVARALLASLYGVIQYSAMLRDVPQSHRDVVAHWIAFTREHRDALLKGWLRPYHPESGYPLIAAGDDRETVITTYQDGIVVPVCGKDGAVPAQGQQVLVVNAGETDQLILDLAWKPRSVQAFDLYGKGIKAPALRSGLQRATIPVGGYLIIR